LGDVVRVGVILCFKLLSFLHLYNKTSIAKNWTVETTCNSQTGHITGTEAKTGAR